MNALTKKGSSESPPRASANTPPTRGSVTARRRRVSSDLALRKAMQKRKTSQKHVSISNTGDEDTIVDPPATLEEEQHQTDESPKKAASQEASEEKSSTKSTEKEQETQSEDKGAPSAEFSSPVGQVDDPAKVAAVSPLTQSRTLNGPKDESEESVTPRKDASRLQHPREEARSSPVELPEERTELVLLRRERDHLKKVNERLIASGRQQAKRIHELNVQIKVLQSAVPSNGDGSTSTPGADNTSGDAFSSSHGEASNDMQQLRERDAAQRRQIESLQQEVAAKTEAAAAAWRDRDHISAKLATLEAQVEQDRAAWEAEMEAALSRTKQYLDELRGTVRSTAEQILAVHKEKWDRERADLESKSQDLQFQLQRHLRQERGGNQKLLRQAEETAAAHARLQANVHRACELLSEARADGEKYRNMLAQQSSGLLSLQDIVRDGVDDDSAWGSVDVYPTRLSHEGSLFEDSMTELVSVWRQRVRQTQQSLAQRDAELKRLQSQRRDAAAFLKRYILRLQTVQDLLETRALLSGGHAASEDLVLAGTGER